jgi:copper chaperone CopZ
VTRAALIEVAGLRCGGCERSAREALEALPGVTAAGADHLAEEVWVTFDPALVGLAAIRSALAGAGFSAEPPATSSR